MVIVFYNKYKWIMYLKNELEFFQRGIWGKYLEGACYFIIFARVFAEEINVFCELNLCLLIT